MKDPIYIVDSDQEDSVFLKENLSKYYSRWPWFLISLIFFTLIGYLVIRYAPKVYQTEAKIKIIDDSKELDIASDALSILSGGPKINLDNEIAVLQSYRILEQVVNELDLDIVYNEVGTIKTRRVFESPVIVSKSYDEDTLSVENVDPIILEILVTDNSINITDEFGNSHILNEDPIQIQVNGATIEIERNRDLLPKNNFSNEYTVTIITVKEAVVELIEGIEISPLTLKSDVLSLILKSESPKLSERLLNELISKFNIDGILDRQLVSKRTVDFIDERFVSLSRELDSIEGNKKDYKQINNLSYIEADAGISLEKRSIAESEVFRLETQLELSNLLEKNLKDQTEYTLLPADIGVENTNINTVVFEYNQGVIEREKLIAGAGENNPAVQLLSSQLEKGKANIIRTVNAYQNQLRISLEQLRKKEYQADAVFARLPEKEKILRSIERQQFIKENLFLLLLQKREEASINFAVTTPSIKIVDYGLTTVEPISPVKGIIMGVAWFFGIFFPLAFFFIKFSLDTKIKTKKDLQQYSDTIPIIAEIPKLKDLDEPYDNILTTTRAESYNFLSTGIKIFLNRMSSNECKVIYVTSAIKGEGKTTVACNLSIALAHLGHKTLLVGADFRNPQVHNFFDEKKNSPGLSTHLYDETHDWKDSLVHSSGSDYSLDICLTGPIPPDPVRLLSGGGFEHFLSEARELYDYLIIDTAPTIPVVDTLIINKHASLTLFVVRAGFTEKKLIPFSKDLSNTGKLSNMAYVINDVKEDKNNGYNYGYGYGYGPDK